MFLLLLGLGWNRDIITIYNLDKIACLPSWKFGFGIIAEKCCNGMSSSLCFTMMNFLDATMAEKHDSVEKMYHSLLFSFSFKFQHLFELIDGHKQCKKALDTDLRHCRMERCDLNRSLALQRFGHFR